MNFIFQGSQKMHVRVAISQKGLVNFFRYAHQIEAFFIPVHTPVSLFMGRFFPLEFHSVGVYCTPLRGIIGITPTEGQIMCPEGCIMPQRDAVDRRSRHPEGA